MSEYGEQHGYGEFYWKDGARVYEGDYFHGRMQGKGIIEFKNGDTFEVRNKEYLLTRANTFVADTGPVHGRRAARTGAVHILRTAR